MMDKLKSILCLMRVNKPIGFFLLLWPTLFAIWFASKGKPELPIIVIFTLGVLLMRSAGCVINDIADRKWDGLVKRTKDRPLILGQVSAQEALSLFFVLIGVAFLLVLQLNLSTILSSVIALLLASAYPFMKRHTHFPQLVLGLAFGWSIPMAFMAIQETLPFEAWLLYFANICWVMAYDTEYALVDKQDDLKIGIKSTAIFFGKWDRSMIFMLQGLFLLLLILLGITSHFGFLYYLGVILASLLFLYQQFLIRDREPQKCFFAFMNNHYVGAILFIALCLDFRFRLP